MSLWPEIRAMLNGEFYVPAGTIITANGTGVPDGAGPGFGADLARELERVAEGLFVWKWINYPAAVFPMRPSINALHLALKEMIRATPGNLVLSAYSQSAVAFAYVWRDDILNPDGELHDRLDDIVAVILYGNPVRAPGIAYGNELGGQSAPGKLNGHVTGGIAGPDCLRPEECVHPVTGRRIVLDFANAGDLYAAAPVGAEPWVKETEVGHNETLIYEAVMDFNGRDIMAFAKEIAQILTMPLSQVIPLVQAIINGLTFLAQGPRAPHWTYSIAPAVDYLIRCGNELRKN
ncbi:lysin B [Mycobacterium phage Yeet]|uniref:Lysin B n=1 Tax=Mycobacterium phage Baka TaxID=2902882 RepID=G1D011_9CAUD|nr:cutinase family protein [Mycobacterium phage Wanda]YP_009636224.1 cutinase family protein [Mycobacterium phage Baka]AWH13861.1 lysin B [Mycobacterium phage Halley]AXQ52052.1 lysin B [Mycobacterium phage Ejimix]AXQ52285.1 lysin B [Mycobacterium phage EricMillard]QBI97495.1 lysin B [Mycobacterium phage Hughesyang]QBI99998.1 lysin B [Mycobacterium phage Phoebus]QDM55628.1 lysin B [Mycobacterium phage HokkenD]QED12200.1 lysin B [Mycobacterium phage Yeet]QZD97922.1 lysin B [Mycobacterium pha